MIGLGSRRRRFGFALRLVAALGLELAIESSFGACVLARDAHSEANRRTVVLGASTLEVERAPGRLALDDATLISSIGDSARAIATYYGTLPFKRARVIVSPSERSGIHGSTNCLELGVVQLDVGSQANVADFRSDWVVTHELLHVAFPWVGRDTSRYDWVGEGLSSYVEPLVRVRAGTLTESDLWRELVRGAPQGLPEAGDQGLDETHTWGRTYWGGALFWLEVDLTIREATADRKSIRDALRGIVSTGADVCVDWPMERVIALGDRATGTHALRDVHARRGRTNRAPDLAGWWRRLGIALRADGSIAFDDQAPWAARRKAMTRD